MTRKVALCTSISSHKLKDTKIYAQVMFFQYQDFIGNFDQKQATEVFPLWSSAQRMLSLHFRQVLAESIFMRGDYRQNQTFGCASPTCSFTLLKCHYVLLIWHYVLNYAILACSFTFLK